MSTKPRTNHASGASNLEVSYTHMAPGYSLSMTHPLMKGPTGLMRIFDIISDNPANAWFAARWDDGTDHNGRDDLDIDIRNVSNNVSRKFKAARDGYRGHHTSRASSSDKRVYVVEIDMPGPTPIFRGLVSFNLNWEVALSDTLNVTDSFGAVLNPGSLSEVHFTSDGPVPKAGDNDNK